MGDNNSPTTTLEREKIVFKSHQAILKWARSHVSHYLNQLLEKLFVLADQADNNNSQTRFFQIRDEIKKQRHNIEQAFIDHLTGALNNYQQQKSTCNDINQSRDQSEQLALVDEQKLEQSLAISSMTRKACADCAELLFALNQRFAVLQGRQQLNDHSNPVAPGVFAEAIQASMGGLLLDGKSQLISFKIFDSLFMAKLKGLYKLLNQHFIDQGILPNLKYHANKNPDPAHPEAAQALPEELQGITSQKSIDHQAELFQLISDIQIQLRQLNPRTPLPAEASLPAKQILESIQQLQLNANIQLRELVTPAAVAESDTSAFVEMAEREAQRSNEVDADVIEIVGLMFEYMLNDEQLPTSIKSLLSYLHTPFLKIALLDKDFFSHPQHPARQLLNSLVAAGERWVEPQGNHKNEVFIKIKLLIEAILQEFNSDIRLLSEQAFAFNHFLRQYARRVRLTEKRAMQAAQGEDKLKQIRLKVDGYLQQKIADSELPAVIQSILFEPWANFLSFNLLRFGSRSEQWQQAASVVDDLLWFSLHCNPGNPEHLQRHAQLSETLPKSLASGFATVGFENTQSERLINSLLALSITTKISLSEPETQPAEADIERIDINQHHPNTAKDDVIQTLIGTEFDTWFIFNAHQAKTLQQRVKLAWSNTTTLHFMFVNRIGQQAALKTGQQLAEEIRAGHTKVLSKLEEKPFFEKALERVLGQLQNNTTSNHSN